ncbi:aconitase X catalytic domain-containing protein [Candidatus Bathyarchaeota archaeon]|nr:aconitase X catalytic domain-containing protein [Candidatus Bathyarchaeota archaeon]
MYLSNEEERILDGEEGGAAATAMKLLVTIGDMFDAERLIPIGSAQVSGISYKTIGDAGLEFIEGFAEDGARASVHTTINPAGMDLENWREMGVPEDFAKKQMRIVTALGKMGISLTCTCTPYLLGTPPRLREHLAWAESSAVIFANSVLGARTNREGGPTSLASAIIGKTPLYGLHQDENRSPKVTVHVKARLQNELDFSLLGFFIGKVAPGDIPLIDLSGQPADVTSLKSMGASMATSGGQALYHVRDLTPESRIFNVNTIRDKIDVERSDLESTKDSLSKDDSPDYVCIGCPHCGIEEIEAISRASHGRQFSKKVMIFTSRHIWSLARSKGLLESIVRAGGNVIRDTCMVVAPLEEMGIRNVMTNSAKAVYYMPLLGGACASLQDLGGALEYAIRGD